MVPDLCTGREFTEGCPLCGGPPDNGPSNAAWCTFADVNQDTAKALAIAK